MSLKYKSTTLEEEGRYSVTVEGPEADRITKFLLQSLNAEVPASADELAIAFREQDHGSPKIAAIRAYRERTGAKLVEAKQAIEKAMTDNEHLRPPLSDEKTASQFFKYFHINQTPKFWQDLTGITVMDCDGWRRHVPNYNNSRDLEEKDFDERISLPEFLDRAHSSTIGPGDIKKVTNIIPV